VLNIIGLGQHKSRSVRKGEVVDVATAEEDVRNAIVEAEAMANVEIRSVFLGVTGSHISGMNNRGFHPITSMGREIADDDVQIVISNAKAINLPAGNTAIHTIRQHFLVDGQDGVPNPVGMVGAKVEVDVHVVHGSTNRLSNAIRVVKGLQLEVEGCIFNGIASAMALLTDEQKELGALVVDFGAGATEYVVYVDGIIKHTGVLAVGGDHVSQDLAVGLKVPMSRAEALKIEHGAAIHDESVKGRTAPLPNEIGLPERSVKLDHLRHIMSLRVEETLQLIDQDLEREGLHDYLRAGAFICGGGSRIPEIDRVGERIFRLPTALGRTSSISGIKSTLDQPEFAAAIGLVKFGSLQLKKPGRRKSLSGKFKDTLDQLLGRVG
jgi:cell division protein FtsA